jgi:glycosyltransferase involved in cell wall biosynthesis
MNNPDKKATFSVIIAVHDQEQELEQNLPLLLTQQYDGDYEVIIVDESSSDGTVDVLKKLKTSHQHLYSTFLPKYHFQKNRRRLALTIGVKAAKYEWVIFADIDKPPLSETWLQELASFACTPTTLLLGYIKRKKNDVRLSTFEDVSSARRIVGQAEHWRATGKGRLMKYLRRNRNYDFIMVRTQQGHETLKFFEG